VNFYYTFWRFLSLHSFG